MYDNMSMKLKLYTETRITAYGVAAVEALRAELVLAKEQAQMSNSAANKAADELKTEQAAQHQCEERISTMAHKLEEITVQCEFLERDSKAKAADLDKALLEVKEARSESRAA